MKSYRSSSTFITVGLLFHELLSFVKNLFSGLMVADLNLLGSVGDLYCFSNTLGMLVLYNVTIKCLNQRSGRNLCFRIARKTQTW